MKRMSRRDFLKIGGVGLGLFVSPSLRDIIALNDFPDFDMLGRVCSGKVEIKAEPDTNSETTGLLYDDAVVEWQYEVAGWNPTRINQRWVKTPDGYIWAPQLQAVKNEPNEPLAELPETSLGPGM